MAERELAHIAVDLRLACMRISRRVRFETIGDGVPPHHFSVLVRLEDAAHTPGDLAESERVSAPSMTKTVAALVEAGYVVRTPHPTDGRQILIELTPAGRQAVAATRQRRDAWVASRIADLSDEDLRVLDRASVLLAELAAR